MKDFLSMIVIYGNKIWDFSEQKVKVPSLHCDARVQTISADVMKLSKPQVMELSPKVASSSSFMSIILEFCNILGFV